MQIWSTCRNTETKTQQGDNPGWSKPIAFNNLQTYVSIKYYNRMNVTEYDILNVPELYSYIQKHTMLIANLDEGERRLC